MDDDDAWDQCLTLEFRRWEGFDLVAARYALVMVNHQPVQSALLRDGDVVALGPAKPQFLAVIDKQICEK